MLFQYCQLSHVFSTLSGGHFQKAGGYGNPKNSTAEQSRCVMESKSGRAVHHKKVERGAFSRNVLREAATSNSGPGPDRKAHITLFVAKRSRQQMIFMLSPISLLERTMLSWLQHASLCL